MAVFGTFKPQLKDNTSVRWRSV